MKLGTQISYKIKWDQLDIFITKTITLMTLFPATATSILGYSMSILIQLFAGGSESPAKMCNFEKRKLSDKLSDSAGG